MVLVCASHIGLLLFFSSIFLLFATMFFLKMFSYLFLLFPLPQLF